MVHEDHIIPGAAHHLNGLGAAPGLGQVEGVALQKAPGNLAVDHVVVYNEYLDVRGGKDLPALQFCLEHLRHLRDRAPVHDLLGNGDGHRRPLAVGAFHTDDTAHQLHQVLYDGQAQAGALHAPVALGVHLAEVLEDFRQVLLPDTAAGVLHPEGNQLLILLLAGLPGNVGADIALLGEFDGVVEDVDENLLDPPLVAVVAAGEGAVALVLHDEPSFGGGHVHHAHHLAHHCFQVVIRIHQLHLARLYLGQVQNVIDDGQQVLGGGLYVLGVGVDLGVSALLHDDVVQADDGVHGGADLVGHIGQELALGNAGLLCLLTDPLDLVDIGLDVRHVQNQDNTALLPTVFPDDLFAVALIVLPVDGKALGNVLVEHLLPEALQHPDIFSQLVRGQAGKNVGRGPVVADQAVVVVQGDHAVPQAFQNLIRRQMAEIVIPAAPHHDDHHGHGEGQSHRGEIEYGYQLAHIKNQYDHGQGGYGENGLILAADLLVGAEAHRPHQGMYGENIGDEDAGDHEQGVQGTVGDADIMEPVRGGQPLKGLIEKAVPVEEHRGQHTKVDEAQDAQQLFRRRRVAIGIGEPAVAQRDKGGAHVLHRDRRHSGLHGGSGQLQEIADILHKTAAHDEDQQLLFPGSVAVEQQDQRNEGQGDAKAFQTHDKIYHRLLPPSILLSGGSAVRKCARKGERGLSRRLSRRFWGYSLTIIVHCRRDVKKYLGFPDLRRSSP